jgi:hypothetical protein
MVGITRRTMMVCCHDESGGSLPALTLSTFARFSLMAVLVACASSGGSASSRSSPDRITAAEIRASNATNAYELISRLRPQWLRAPGGGSISGGVARSQAILVYLDGNRVGDLTTLSTISVTGVTSMQWLDAARAPTVLSDIPAGGIAGAIAIRTQ